MKPAFTVDGVIRGVVTAVPKNKVGNDGWPDAVAAAKMTGVESRRHALYCTQTDLAVAAAQELLRGLEWPPESVDFVVYVTQTPEEAMPAPAYDFHQQLGLPDRCMVVPVNYSCSGWVQGLALAMMLTERGPHVRVLLAAGDTISQICSPTDRATAPLFGDAVSVTAVESDPTLTDTTTLFIGNDGHGNDSLAYEGPGDHLRMNGPEVFAFTLRCVPPLVEAVLGSRSEPPRFALFHQANKFMLSYLVGRCNIDPATHAPTNIGDWGNTSSASIPLLICELGDLGPDDRAAVFGFGAGWAWAGANVLLGKIAHRAIIEL